MLLQQCEPRAYSQSSLLCLEFDKRQNRENANEHQSYRNCIFSVEPEIVCPKGLRHRVSDLFQHTLLTKIWFNHALFANYHAELISTQKTFHRCPQACSPLHDEYTPITSRVVVVVVAVVFIHDLDDYSNTSLCRESLTGGSKASVEVLHGYKPP
jgi:hypothetical protein